MVEERGNMRRVGEEDSGGKWRKESQGKEELRYDSPWMEKKQISLAVKRIGLEFAA